MTVVSSFYKYVRLDNPSSFQEEHQEFCNDLGVKGKVLVSKEGINGTVSGTKEQINKYEKKLISYKEFSDMYFKKTTGDRHPFRRTIVRVREEIVTSKFNVETKNVGKYISSKELKNMYDNNEEFVIIDARNSYESKIGRFKDSITPKIDTFREFPRVISKIDKYKKKKIVLYCTGGVRCEKASALLIKEGFLNVNQLHGGILSYIEQYPDTYFEGRCFVFDNRLSIKSGENVKDISVCEKCHVPCSDYINCTNQRCDKMFIECSDCREQYEYTCSKTCRSFVMQHKR